MTDQFPEGFPDLFGCRRHRPDSVKLLRWDEPLVDDFWGRRTAASGLGWTLALDRSEDGDILTIVDCSWAANALREMGVDLSVAPVVAVQTWSGASALADVADCASCEERLHGLDAALRSHLSNGLEDADAEALPNFPRLKWTDPPGEIAAIVLTDLRQRSILGEAMTVLEATAGWDLVPKAPVYVQFRLGLEGELQIEARKDFTFWDVVVDETRVAVFSAAGFSVDGPYQFEMLLGPDPHDLSHRDAIEVAIRTATEVFQPKRKRIHVERFTGVSPLEGELSSHDYAIGQRRIDRLGWPDLFEAADRRLEDQGDGVRLFDLLDQQHPEFAEIVALAHLDEYFDRMDDVHVLVPTETDDIINGIEGDLLTSEDLVGFVLRHSYRWGSQRVRAAADDDVEVDPEAIAIETIGHERFAGRLRNGELIEIGGLTVVAAPDGSCVNGSFAMLHGVLEPPVPPPLVIPDLD